MMNQRLGRHAALRISDATTNRDALPVGVAHVRGYPFG
jgi:hypothetical protein